MCKTLSILGDGGWGTALAVVLNRLGHHVNVWGPFPDYSAEIRQTCRNPRYLPGFDIPEGITWTADDEEALHAADVVVLAVPSRFYRQVCERFRARITAGTLVVSVTKGLCAQSGKRMSEIAAETFQSDAIAVLSGPSHAEEVARGIPTAVVTAAPDAAMCLRVQSLFHESQFRVYTATDPVGVELGGALKNIMAIAAGISDGLGFGDNTRAALITRGLAEMTRLGVALGAQAETFAGLSGMGDLIVTATSRHSRNRAVGERLGQGESLSAILEGMQTEAEGIWNCATARALGRKFHIETPIIDQVHDVLNHQRNPMEAVAALMERDPKPENTSRP